MTHPEQLDLFAQRLPARPYCSDDLRFGMKVRAAKEAIRARYVQPNYPWLLVWLVLDADYPGAAYGWKYLDAPVPNIVAENPENQHAHLFYGLQIPVHVDPERNHKSIRYAAAVQYALLKKLQADPGYNGPLAKNPLSPAWTVYTFEEFLYDLDTLAQGLTLEPWQDARRRLPDYGLGRNVTLFNQVRRYAYRSIQQFWSKGYEAFADDVLAHTACTNSAEFGTRGLHYSEFKHVAKSVAKWTWNKFSPEEFSRIQAERKRKDTARRRAEADRRAQGLLDFMAENPGLSIREISRATGTPFESTRRLLNSIYVTYTPKGVTHEPYQDKAPSKAGGQLASGAKTPGRERGETEAPEPSEAGGLSP